MRRCSSSCSSGPLDGVEVTDDAARFPSADAEAMRQLLDSLADDPTNRIATGIVEVDTDGGDVVVRFGDGPSPGAQEVAGRMVRCHLHGPHPH